MTQRVGCKMSHVSEKPGPLPAASETHHDPVVELPHESNLPGIGLSSTAGVVDLHLGILLVDGMTLVVALVDVVGGLLRHGCRLASVS